MEFCILECRRFVAPDPGGAVKRIVRNHEFDFYMDGARTVTFDGRVYPVSAGSLCVRRPGAGLFGRRRLRLLPADRGFFRKNAAGKLSPAKVA